MKTIIITGLGRCGSSLAMQLLSHYGVPCYGRYPAFEEDILMPGNITQEFLDGNKCKAIKILEVHLSTLNLRDCIVVHLLRDPKEQAKSMLKLLSIANGRQEPVCRDHRRLLEQSIKKDNAKLAKYLRQQDCVVFKYSFEDIIFRPDLFLAFLGYQAGVKLQNDALDSADDVVFKRDHKCFDGMLEMQLIRERGTRSDGRTIIPPVFKYSHRVMKADY